VNIIVPPSIDPLSFAFGVTTPSNFLISEIVLTLETEAKRSCSLPISGSSRFDKESLVNK
jgi:hypothetical protein